MRTLLQQRDEEKITLVSIKHYQVVRISSSAPPTGQLQVPCTITCDVLRITVQMCWYKDILLFQTSQ